jgi:hypothetical protein
MLRLASLENRDWRQPIAAFGVMAFSLASAALLIPARAHTDEPSSDTVGAITGEAIAVQGPMNVDVVQGQVKTMLRSGSDIRVKSGQAQIELVEGGRISICGPAHLSVLKSGASLTLALDSGTVHAFIEHAPALTIYTAQIQAKPIAIGDGPQDTLAGFDAEGAMCIRAISGAVRVEQQLTAQSVVVPQGGDILVTNGQLETLRSGAGHCSCDFQVVKAAPPRPAPAQPTAPPEEISRLATPKEIAEAERARSEAPANSQKPAPAGDAPVYQVFMPPLSYDAGAKVQRDNFDPQFMVLVRRVRVRPTLIFQGRVEGEALVAQNTPPPNATPSAAPPAKPASQTPPNSQNNDTVMNRVRAFFHRLFS